MKKESKVRDEEESSEESNSDDSLVVDNNLDFQTWKKRNRVGYNQKVFIIKGGYGYLRDELINLGWYENDDVKSVHFDLKWTTKINDIDFPSLKSGQMVNHFNNNHHLTSKFGITRKLRTLIL